MDIARLIGSVHEIISDAVVISQVRADDVLPAVRWISPAFTALTGFGEKDALGQPLPHLKATDPYTLEEINDAYLLGRACEVEVHATRKDGSTFWAELRLHPIHDAAGTLEGFMSLHRDISVRKEREEFEGMALSERVFFEEQLMLAKANSEAAQRRLMDAIQALPDAFVIYDSDDRLVVCNDQYRNVYCEVKDLIEPGVKFEKLLREGLRLGQYVDAIGQEETWLAERLESHLNPGPPQEQELTGERVLRVHEKRTHSGDIVGCRVDISEMKRSQRQLETYAIELKKAHDDVRRQALHDTLTGLPNRRYLDERIAEIQTEENPRLVLLHIDLDRFKQINDTLGHAAGDYVLTQTAARLRAAITPEDFPARIGGDEFVIVLRAFKTVSEAMIIARELVALLSRPVRFEGNLCRFGASIGVAFDDTGTLLSDELLVNADVALYRAKETGRGRVAYYTDELHQEVLDKKKLADEIMVGLEQGQFFPVYQPQFDANTLDFVGAEMLMRWHHPERGVLAPGAFGDVAEDLGVIGEVEQQLFDRVYVDIEGLTNLGVHIPKVSFNLAVSRILEPALGQELSRLGAFGTVPTVELLESMSLDQIDPKIALAIDALKDQGLPIEIDDFGSCRASIVGLLNVGPTRLKIDQQLIMPMLKSDLQQELVHAIIEIGRALDIGVVAEGVETFEHCDVLRTLGCDILQGYALAKPMDANLLATFLQTEPWRVAYHDWDTRRSQAKRQLRG